MGASAGADAHGRIRTTQSVIFEGSRLSQCGGASASIHACTCTSLPSESWTSVFPHDAAPGSFIASAHVPCDVTNDVIA